MHHHTNRGSPRRSLRRGVTAVEYTMLAGLIGVAILSGMIQTQTSLATSLEHIASECPQD